MRDWRWALEDAAQETLGLKWAIFGGTIVVSLAIAVVRNL